jgi:glutathione synthase/RimK-type ligase-like ATP-grasp enzyme
MRTQVLPYNITSLSSRSLAKELGCKRIKLNNSKYVQQSSDVVINWGNSRPVYTREGLSIIPTLNNYADVAKACNKLNAFRYLSAAAVPCPDWDKYYETAVFWIEQGFKVYCRKVLTGHSGSGIIIASTVDELVDAPLYTKQVYAAKEFRVHVFKGEVIDYAKKARRRDYSENDRPSGEIRSYSKGWIFIREGVQLPQAVERESLKAIKALGLDFGAVDICTIKGTNDEQVCVYEVNTSPGIHSSTIKSYANAIRRYINA